MSEKYGNNTTVGDRNNWPRRIARAHRDREQALYALSGEMDDRNQSFAIAEFVAEREAMAEQRAIRRARPKRA